MRYKYNKTKAKWFNKRLHSRFGVSFSPSMHISLGCNRISSTNISSVLVWVNLFNKEADSSIFLIFFFLHTFEDILIEHI